MGGKHAAADKVAVLNEEGPEDSKQVAPEYTRFLKTE